ncbi:membrane protein YqaA with SNARE-associated domain [Pseudomonas duriflava]|uniref:Membrane protein YqaA with SNARE-associated domain n=1 Tax=Pseudomonas duriflava TaxID=459528 RepID=A0A562QLL2_9PSED|nr:membrane protein YqaA with SNARE-associated domain [Pseudomonas duriflava]
MEAFAAYGGLFLVSLLAATLLPAQSEAALAVLLLNGSYSTGGLLIAAITGNTLGSMVNWGLGRSIEHYRTRRWFPVSARQLERAQRGYQRYGRWSLLLSWVPIIGDPLTMIAGIMREPLPVFLLLVGLAKAGRYLVVTAVTLNWA